MKNAVLLSVMMFLQFMMLPVWFVPMFPYVQALPDSGSWVVWCGLIMGFGTFTSPLFGMFGWVAFGAFIAVAVGFKSTSAKAQLHL